MAQNAQAVGMAEGEIDERRDGRVDQIPARTPTILAIGSRHPVIDEQAWVAASATVVGSVTLGPGASLWYSAVARADLEDITVGADSNIQDGVVLHADPGYALTIGRSVSVGHNAVLHGCRIEDDVLIGMNATIMNGAVIGASSLVAAGAVVTEGTEIPAGSLVLGSPARVRRELTATERSSITHNAARYVELAQQHLAADHLNSH
ncbi:gamma carbonic anhydrase family protein [Streptomyces sp. NPDC001833]|uniref:gamma carbonic anhydrase family protein n=1 Tax=Streptomyces sp. NPDC001833 TaxID=3154658 RepID=UPI00331A92A5